MMNTKNENTNNVMVDVEVENKDEVMINAENEKKTNSGRKKTGSVMKRTFKGLYDYHYNIDRKRYINENNYAWLFELITGMLPDKMKNNIYEKSFDQERLAYILEGEYLLRYTVRKILISWMMNRRKGSIKSLDILSKF